MGAHKGWSIIKRDGATIARVAIPGTGREKSKSFHGRTAAVKATAWAKKRCADYLGKAALLVDLPTTTTTLLNEYLVYLTNRGRSASHMRDVRLVLERLAKKCPDLGSGRAGGQVAQFLASLTSQTKDWDPLGPATRNRYLVTIRAICGWAIERQRIIDDPTTGHHEAKVPDYLKPQFTIDELRVLAQAIDDPYYARFAIQLYAGMRSAEAHALDWRDIDFSSRVITIRQGKGSKDRIVPMVEELAVILNRLLMPRAGLLFGEKLKRQAGSQHIRDFRHFLQRVKVPLDDRSPHSLRHSYAGIQTATGVPSLLLAAYLGHASTQTTAEYTKLATTYLRQVAGWPRGEMLLLIGWSEELPKAIR